MRYFDYELNTLDACWIAVDVWSNSSRCRQESVYLLWTWCLYTWSCLDILITMCFSINCSKVICSPTVDYAILREATSETYGPRVYFPSYKFPIYYFPSYKFPIYFILESLLFNLYHKNTKIIYLILLSLSDPTFASGHEGIDNPFITLVARFLFVCVGMRWLARGLLLDWYLGSQKLREILTLLCCITLSSSRDNQRMLKR